MLLSLVLDIKNNKQRNKSSAVSVSSVLSAGVLKWLKSSGMEEVQLRTLSWAKVLQPKKKVRQPLLLFLHLSLASSISGSAIAFQNPGGVWDGILQAWLCSLHDHAESPSMLLSFSLLPEFSQFAVRLNPE